MIPIYFLMVHILLHIKLYYFVIAMTIVLQNACEIVKARLEPIKKRNPGGTWAEWVKTAYFEKVNLCASGFYA